MTLPEVGAKLEILDHYFALALFEQLFRQHHVWPKAIELRRTRRFTCLDQMLAWLPRDYQTRERCDQDQIADDCMKKVTELDKRAMQIIAAHRAANRSRNVAPGDSRPPPAELPPLERDRNNVILSAIEQLRVAFGDAEFKRFDEYVRNQGDGKRAVLSSANKKPLPIQVTITLFDRDGETTRNQFAANERVIVQVAMLNNSTQMIAVKESEMNGWLRLRPTRNTALPLGIPLRMSGRNSGNDSAVDVPPTQLIIVGRIELGPEGLKLKPDEYRIALPHLALLNRRRRMIANGYN